MFAALTEKSIIPDHVPLYIALAPVTKLTDTGTYLIQLLTKHYVLIS
jgi:hypothetical protein